MATIAEAFAEARLLEQASDLPQAEQLYRQVVEADPSPAQDVDLE